MSLFCFLYCSSIPSHTYQGNLIPGLPPPLKILFFPQFRWLKPLGFSNGSYINPPIVLMVGKESQGIFIGTFLLIQSVPCFFAHFRGVDCFFGWWVHLPNGTHQAWMIRTHSKFQVHIVTWQQTVITKTRQGDRDGWVGLFFREELLVLLRGGVGGGFMNIFLFVTLRIWVTDSIWVYFSDGLKPPTRIQPQKRPELRFEMSS